ncbi:hypothetical protein F5Y08DRAFT_324570 [Xylaria arbuscula]|uniref:N-acetyltransferase domain-containing protein n=1 Tax=Xylaria arbuscula TaxID=114810 RepID=A0A9W8TRU8_9PEZI|nr:hypothetical protein F5Y08DRAFT_324570 [Xylaria arbuscula]KAJ3579834.1 hypothetical protein NPX13_g740 [Xylaria arbuscula]
MPVENHSVIPINQDDIPAIGAFLQASKLQLTINRLLVKDWPNPTLQKAHYTRAIDNAVSNPNVTSLKVINNVTGDAVAQLFYQKKSCAQERKDELPEDSEEKQAKLEVPESFTPAVYYAVMEAVDKLEPVLDTNEYIELTHMYVEPSSRRQGIGSWLLQIVQEAAVAAKLPLSLCSEPNYHSFFAKRGLKDQKHIDIDLAQWAAPYSGYGPFRLCRMVSQE